MVIPALVSPFLIVSICVLNIRILFLMNTFFFLAHLEFKLQTCEFCVETLSVRQAAKGNKTAAKVKVSQGCVVFERQFQQLKWLPFKGSCGNIHDNRAPEFFNNLHRIEGTSAQQTRAGAADFCFNITMDVWSLKFCGAMNL